MTTNTNTDIDRALVILPAQPGWRVAYVDGENLKVGAVANLRVEPLTHIALLGQALAELGSGIFGFGPKIAQPCRSDGSTFGSFVEGIPPSDKTNDEVLHAYLEDLKRRHILQDAPATEQDKVASEVQQ